MSDTGTSIGRGWSPEAWSSWAGITMLSATSTSLDMLDARLFTNATGGNAVSKLEEKPAATPAQDISELRRKSGLTWQKLAELFGVERRTLHFWASGKPLNEDNYEQLQRLLGAIRMIDRGTAELNRKALFAPRADDGGASLFDRLQRGEYEELVAQFRSAPPLIQRKQAPQLSAEQRALRRPPPPAELVEALNDRVEEATTEVRGRQSRGRG